MMLKKPRTAAGSRRPIQLVLSTLSSPKSLLTVAKIEQREGQN
jgi:hypothetical protein